ncbi:hypothetical protein QN277_029292 [Acacia crassicarpa]|uniref:TPX2 C-terminal domain-containing protein n=1 Tax=Acacia crassicarpa TaxID=499986 RepID=A0AAE1J7W5_9FABA|nr:hypothetical protein QN277_029292 [Acacia crassicarpa]
MAGEIEETFSMNLQGDSIHSGSISFGRFENEPLSWERRSSFSHNRYLEEVEKCSKPGSVIEKKAYFEAHFKKKGLLGFNIPASHDGSDQTTSENDGSERIGNQEDFESNENVHGALFDRRSQDDFEPIGDGQYVQFDQRSLEDFEPVIDSHYGQYEQRSFEDFEPDEEGNHVLFEEGPAGSDYNGECGVTESEREDVVTEGPRVSSSNQHTEFAVNNYYVLEDAIDNNRILDEAPKPENETSSTTSVDDTMVVEVRREHDDTVDNNESLRPMNVTEPDSGVEQAALTDPPSPSPKETKSELGLSSVVNRVQVWKNSSARTPRGSARNSSRESPRKTRVGKNLSKLSAPTTHSVSRTPKEVSKSERKVTCERKSENVLGIKKAAESQHSVSKANSRGIQDAKRVNPTVNSVSTNSEARLRAAAFNFKSRERAEKRKEFYMKLEEKMHAKEEEMNQMKAMSKEKTEAEIRKLRKNLNFKATPMPSFYRTASASASASDGNKAISDNNKSKKLQNKPKCAVSISGAATSSNLKISSRNDQDADESVTSAKPRSLASSEASVTSPSPTANQSRPVDSKQTSRSLEGRNDQRPRCKTGVSDRSLKEARRPNSREKRSGQTPKQGIETTRKNSSVRSIDVRSSSRIGSLTVHVAS